MLQPLPWHEPWDNLPESLHEAFQSQLQHELVPGHPLFGQPCTLLGKHAGADDVLVALANGQLAVVHLTWGGPGDARYPNTTFFASWGDFAAQRMAEDALGYS